MATSYTYKPVSTTYHPISQTAVKPPTIQKPVSYGGQLPQPSDPTHPGTTLSEQLAALNPSGQPVFLGMNPLSAQRPAAPSSSGPSNYKYSLDPAIAAAFAMAHSQRTSARDRGKRDLLMKSGLWKIAQELFGGDTSWIETVKNNPFSDMANIANAYEGRLGKINQANEDLNQQNLFFSSTRTGDVLPSLYRQRGQEEYGTEVAVRDSINSIEDAYMQAELQDKIARAQAEQAGAASAWQTYGWGTGGSSGGGGGGDLGTGVGRPGEQADLPVVVGWDPNRNSDAQYDMSGATPVPGGYVGPNGYRYDEKGRRI